MKKLVAVSVVILAGCVSMPTVENFGTGRFVLFNVAGSTVMQMDTVSPEECNLQVRNAARTPGLDIACSTVSQEKTLPYSFSMTNVVTGQVTFARSTTLDGCKLMFKEFEKNERPGQFKFSECK